MKFTLNSRKFWSQPITTVNYILKMLLILFKSLILRVFAKMLDIFGPNMTHFKKTLCVWILLSESESNLSHKGKFRDPTISRKKPHEPMAKTVTLPAIEMICIRRYVGRRITWFYSYDCKKVPHLKNWCHRRSIQLFSNHIQWPKSIKCDTFSKKLFKHI